MTDGPLVTCIMPTRNRRRFVGQAIWYWLRQDYAPRELVIVDDGSDAVGDLVPADRRIRYLHLDRAQPLGSKRNLACECGTGDLIAHWDDDDWSAPDRLSAQVAALRGRDADVCGASDPPYYRLAEGDAWRLRPPTGVSTALVGGSLLYTRARWEAGRFPEVNTGEDRQFVDQCRPGRVVALADAPWFVPLLHTDNATPRNLGDPRWHREVPASLNAMLHGDGSFYAMLRHRTPAYVPRGPHAATERVTVAAPFMVYDGYGSMGEYTALSMARAGATVDAVPLHYDPAGLSPEIHELLARSAPEPTAPVLCCTWPLGDLARFRASRDRFIATMWESSRLPEGWADRIREMRAVMVPSEFLVDVFRASGVTQPLAVVPLGVDPDVYPFLVRPERPGLTALTVGTFVPRKNIDVGIAAWKRAFVGQPDARLIIKTRFRQRAYVPDDPRIEFVDSEETTHGIAHWYARADVLLALGNEGFGLPLVEGMATGLPVITLNAEGQADICAAAGDRVLPVPPARWEPFNQAPFGPAGVRAIPDVDAVAARLRWVDTHRTEARSMGAAASAWAHTHRNVWQMGPALLDVMERHAQPSRSLRHMDTLWAPGSKEPSAADTYTAHLARALPHVRVTTTAPDLRGVRVLHVQYAPGAFPETVLTRWLQVARARGIPVLATEHAVGDEAYAWERDADLLIALTEADTETLRARWPAQRVECIPSVAQELGQDQQTWTRVAARHRELWQSLAVG